MVAASAFSVQGLLTALQENYLYQVALIHHALYLTSFVFNIFCIPYPEWQILRCEILGCEEYYVLNPHKT